MSDPLVTELELLRHFYLRWVAFHAIPRDAIHRHKLEAASQNLVDAHHAYKEYVRSFGKAPEVLDG